MIAPRLPGYGARPRRPPLACVARTSPSQTGFRVKKMVSGTFHSKNSFLSPCLHLHPSFRLSAHSRSPPPRDLGCPSTNFSANFTTGVNGRLGFFISRFYKTFPERRVHRGAFGARPFPEPAQRGRHRGCRGRESCTGLGISRRVRVILSPDLNLMGTNEREFGSVNHCNIQAV